MTNIFDEAIALAAVNQGHYQGSTHPDWENMVGPFGGITAAVLLQSVMLDVRRLGDPISLTVNFCAGVTSGPFEIKASPARTNRSTQHWTMALLQEGQTVITATAVTAARRETWSTTDAPMPAVGKPSDYAVKANAPMAWTKRYEVRPIQGPLPDVWDGQESSSLTQQWVRNAQARPLDLLSLSALCDSFFPRIFVRRATRVPIGTVSMTCYFHCNDTQLAVHTRDQEFLLCQAQGQAFRNGFFDQTGLLWTESGMLVASTSQIVYYKE